LLPSKTPINTQELANVVSLHETTDRAGLEAGASQEFQVKKSVEWYCWIEKQWRHEHNTFHQ
jgi:hypothetical protein